MEKNNKLLAARDVILAYMMKEELTVDEAREVLHMCRSEIDASVNRLKIKEVTPHQSPKGDSFPERWIPRWGKCPRNNMETPHQSPKGDSFPSRGSLESEADKRGTPGKGSLESEADKRGMPGGEGLKDGE